MVSVVPFSDVHVIEHMVRELTSSFYFGVKLNCFTVLLVGFLTRIHFDFLLVTVSYFFTYIHDHSIHYVLS